MNEMKAYVFRERHERGAVMGSLYVEKEIAGEENELAKVCGTVEREADCLPVGKYRICLGRCKYRNRKMPFLLPLAEGEQLDAVQGMQLDAALGKQQDAALGGQQDAAPGEPDATQCDLCCKLRHQHEFGDTAGFTSLPCAMVQPGNGPFTMGKGSVLVGEACAPGFVLDSQRLFTTLYERVKKAIWRGHEVTVEIASTPPRGMRK